MERNTKRAIRIFIAYIASILVSGFIGIWQLFTFIFLAPLWIGVIVVLIMLIKIGLDSLDEVKQKRKEINND